MKAVVAAFNQEKAPVGAFSVITNLRMELFEALAATRRPAGQPGQARDKTDFGVFTQSAHFLDDFGSKQARHWPYTQILQNNSILTNNCIFDSYKTGVGIIRTICSNFLLTKFEINSRETLISQIFITFYKYNILFNLGWN